MADEKKDLKIKVDNQNSVKSKKSKKQTSKPKKTAAKKPAAKKTVSKKSISKKTNTKTNKVKTSNEKIGAKELKIKNDIEEGNEYFANIDSNDLDPIQLYLYDVSKHDRITPEEEVELSKLVQEGLKAKKVINTAWQKVRKEVLKDLKTKQYKSEWHKKQEFKKAKENWAEKNYPAEYKMHLDGLDARNRFIEANLRLVVSFAKKYVGRGLPFIDLIQEGSLGLIKAVEKYDYTLNYKFSTYATWWIRQAMARACSDKSRTIRVPVHMLEKHHRVNKAYRQLIQDNEGKEPTDYEIAEYLGVPVEKVMEVKHLTQEPLSLEAPVGEDDGTIADFVESVDTIAPNEVVDKDILKKEVLESLNILSPRENKIVRMRYGLDDGHPKTLEEIGTVFGVTRERIRQIENKAMETLKLNADKILKEANPRMHIDAEEPKKDLDKKDE